MKTPTTISVLFAVLSLAGCKAGTPSNAEKSVVTEIKHEMTVGGRLTVPQRPGPEGGVGEAAGAA
jgi:hypothetical protein